ncbi:MAG: hypothetical protein ABW184_04620 [Sphingobium sp.]
MTRYLIALAAAATTAASMLAFTATAMPTPAPAPAAAPRVISTTQDGKPILLKRMVVTATALPA